MDDHLRVAVGQFLSVPDKAANLKRSLELVHEGADRDATLVVLPEAALYPLNVRPDDLAEAAEPLDGEFVSALVAAAVERGVTVVAGTIESPGKGSEAPDARAYNTVVALSPAGMIGAYRKIHLFDGLGFSESRALRAGPNDEDVLLVLRAGEMGVGVVTCYELRFPEIFRELVDRGSSVILVPSAWVAGPLKEDHWTTLLRARAIENTCYVVGASQPPPSCAGRSMVVDPMGVVIAALGEQEGILVADLDPARVAEVRRVLPVLQQRRFEVRPRA